MGMPAAKDFWTVQDVYDLPDDGNRYETVNGEPLVTPGPSYRHQAIVTRLVVPLQTYVERHGLGMVMKAPAEATRGEVTRVQPDLMVIPPAWMQQRRYGSVGDLLLVVEILSPSSRRADRFTKRVEYQRQGVELYWVVDPQTRTVEAWTPATDLPTPVGDTLRWHPAGVIEPFTLPVAAIFRDLD
jgi:Uma2 family endonuclease